MQFEKFKAKAKEALSNFPAFADWAKPKSKRDLSNWGGYRWKRIWGGDMLALFSGMAALAASSSGALAATGPMTTAQLSKSMVIKYSELTVRTFPNGGTQRRVMSGTLPTGRMSSA